LLFSGLSSTAVATCRALSPHSTLPEQQQQQGRQGRQRRRQHKFGCVGWSHPATTAHRLTQISQALTPQSTLSSRGMACTDARAHGHTDPVTTSSAPHIQPTNMCKRSHGACPLLHGCLIHCRSHTPTCQHLRPCRWQRFMYLLKNVCRSHTLAMLHPLALLRRCAC
jgi:hypothetical protein